jgi:hypothetical protein
LTDPTVDRYPGVPREEDGADIAKTKKAPKSNPVHTGHTSEVHKFGAANRATKAYEERRSARRKAMAKAFGVIAAGSMLAFGAIKIGSVIKDKAENSFGSGDKKNEQVNGFSYMQEDGKEVYCNKPKTVTVERGDNFTKLVNGNTKTEPGVNRTELTNETFDHLNTGDIDVIKVGEKIILCRTATLTPPEPHETGN